MRFKIVTIIAIIGLIAIAAAAQTGGGKAFMNPASLKEKAFLTASQKPGLREKAKKLGAAAFFQKPYDGSELLETIRLVLAGERLNEESQVYAI